MRRCFFTDKYSVMKTKLIALLLVGTNTVAAQEVVTVDFETKNIATPTKHQLRTADWVKLKIIHLPTSIYKVSIDKADTVIKVGPAPALFSVLSFGDGFNSLLAGLAGSSVRAFSKMDQYKALEPGTITLETSKYFSLDRVSIDGSMQALERVTSSGDKKATMKLITDMRSTVFNFHYKFRDDVIKALDKLAYRVSLSTINAVDFKSDAEAIISKRLGYDKELESSYQTYYNEILPQYDDVVENIGLRAGDSMLTAYKKGFVAYLDKFDTTFNEALIAKVYNNLNSPGAPDFFVSLPYRLKGDITKLKLDVNGIDAAKTPQSYNTTIELERYPNRLWAFTTGVFVSGLRSNDFAMVTNLKENAANPGKLDTVNYSIIEEQNNKVSVGITALMNVGGYFGNSEVGGFASFGPGLSLEKTPQFRLLLGGGLLFGRNNKISISGGMIFGPVKRLSGNYNLTNTYSPAPIDITRDKFDKSWYAALAYSLFN